MTWSAILPDGANAAGPAGDFSDAERASQFLDSLSPHSQVRRTHPASPRAVEERVARLGIAEASYLVVDGDSLEAFASEDTQQAQKHSSLPRTTS